MTPRTRTCFDGVIRHEPEIKAGSVGKFFRRLEEPSHMISVLLGIETESVPGHPILDGVNTLLLIVVLVDLRVRSK